MSTIVIKVPTSTIQKMQQFYQRDLLRKFLIQCLSPKKTITAYTSGKVMFQGATAEKNLPYGAIRQVLYQIRKATVSSTALPAGFRKASSAVTRSVMAVISVLWWSVPSMQKSNYHS